MSALLHDYALLRVVWWLILGVLLIGFAIADGFDVGLGATFTLLGRTDAERRTLLASIEPVWEKSFQKKVAVIGASVSFLAVNSVRPGRGMS